MVVYRTISKIKESSVPGGDLRRRPGAPEFIRACQRTDGRAERETFLSAAQFRRKRMGTSTHMVTGTPSFLPGSKDHFFRLVSAD